ncbi:hypothetical protein CDAR_317601 [Caerostris darwini]|uniref:Uncharacterized protein n=1 Tax=Caerostris darwini TaxID=1538125 RepID=A0AAV4SFV2_9ARAC|nr:hypothetical protein CDAR_317601 [Caerostris darwini]
MTHGETKTQIRNLKRENPSSDKTAYERDLALTNTRLKRKNFSRAAILRDLGSFSLSFCLFFLLSLPPRQHTSFPPTARKKKQRAHGY